MFRLQKRLPICPPLPLDLRSGTDDTTCRSLIPKRGASGGGGGGEGDRFFSLKVIAEQSVRYDGTVDADLPIFCVSASSEDSFLALWTRLSGDPAKGDYGVRRYTREACRINGAPLLPLASVCAFPALVSPPSSAASAKCFARDSIYCLEISRKPRSTVLNTRLQRAARKNARLNRDEEGFCNTPLYAM